MHKFEKVQVAVLGYNGMGKNHIQVLNKLGVNICGILTSSFSSGKSALEEIKDEFDIETKAYTNLSDLIDENNPQAIHICTPDKIHFLNILKAFDESIPVFCEKPLFWNQSISKKEVSENLSVISRHPNRKIFLNTSNSALIGQIKNQLPDIPDIRTFDFEFNTNGKNRFNNIASDLMPHGLAMLQEIAGTSFKANDFSSQIEEKKYACNFKYKNISVSFRFCQDQHIQKKLEFSINNIRFKRLQSIKNQNYTVSIKDFESNEIFEVNNPLEVFINEFLQFCTSKNKRKKDGFENAFWNLSMMSKMLLTD